MENLKYFYIHLGPDGNQPRRIEYLRPDIEETKNIPSEIIEESKLYLKVENAVV